MKPLYGSCFRKHSIWPVSYTHLEQPVDVLFHQLQFTGKPGLTFAEDDIEPVRFGVIQQAGEFRAVPIGTRVIIIAVNVRCV